MHHSYTFSKSVLDFLFHPLACHIFSCDSETLSYSHPGRAGNTASGQVHDKLLAWSESWLGLAERCAVAAHPHTPTPHPPSTISHYIIILLLNSRYGTAGHVSGCRWRWKSILLDRILVPLEIFQHLCSYKPHQQHKSFNKFTVKLDVGENWWKRYRDFWV